MHNTFIVSYNVCMYIQSISEIVEQTLKAYSTHRKKDRKSYKHGSKNSFLKIFFRNF